MVEFGSWISIGIYMLVMLGIGLYAMRKATGDSRGYILGGRQLGPAVTALSAGAADMSGWILLGLPGAAFVSGLGAAWIAVGLIAGALLNWILVAPRLRTYTEVAGDALTIPDFFEKRFGDRTHALRILSAAVIILFFTLYTSSGMVSGGKLFESAFGLSYTMGILVTTGVVVAYTFAGGFLAVSLTDFVQGCIMFVALILVPVVTLLELPLGAAPGLGGQLLQPAGLLEGLTIAGLVSSLAWGLGYFGQPHIIVRFMAIRHVRDMPVAAGIGMSWMTISLIGALATGIAGAAYAQRAGLPIDDPETVFIVLSQLLFHPLIAGFLLAAILAAIMSTISSQLLVASSSLAEDVYRVFLRRSAGEREQVLVGRLGVVGVALVALWLARAPDSSVLELVADAWAGFGAAFGPVILFSLSWRRMTGLGALAGMLAGAGTVLVWTYVPVLPDPETGVFVPLSSLLYSMVPGFAAGALAIVLVSRLGRPAAAVLETFEAAERARVAR